MFKNAADISVSDHLIILYLNRSIQPILNATTPIEVALNQFCGEKILEEVVAHMHDTVFKEVESNPEKLRTPLMKSALPGVMIWMARAVASNNGKSIISAVRLPATSMARLIVRKGYCFWM